VLGLSAFALGAQAQTEAPVLPSPVAAPAPADATEGDVEAPLVPGAPPASVDPSAPPAPVDPNAPPAPVDPNAPPTPYYPQPAPPPETNGYLAGPTAYAPGPTLSGTPSPLGGPGAREHDGFFLRLTIGAGAGFASYREAVDGSRTEDVETGGVAGETEVAIGGRIIGNLIVHGNLLLTGVGDANKTVSGVKNASYKIDTSLALLGGGATYYFMPYNVYLSGMLGVGSMNESRDDKRVIESGSGIGGALMLGKEWWAGPRAQWGLGAALRGTLLSAPVTVGGVDSRMFGSQITIAFSATYN